MSTSASHKLRSLQEQITRLRARQDHLFQKRAKEIMRLMERLGIASLDDMTLAGALLFIAEKINASDPLVHTWAEGGRRFLRSKKHQKRAPSQKITPPSTVSQLPDVFAQ